MKIASSQNINPSLFDVSVVIPTFNRIAMLKEAIASLYEQDYEGLVEIIVVDDNSQDGTPKIIRQSYLDINLMALSQNVGSCCCS